MGSQRPIHRANGSASCHFVARSAPLWSTRLVDETPKNQPDPSEPPVGLFISLGVVTGFLFLIAIVVYLVMGAAWFLRF